MCKSALIEAGCTAVQLEEEIKYTTASALKKYGPYAPGTTKNARDPSSKLLQSISDFSTQSLKQELCFRNRSQLFGPFEGSR